MSRMMPFIIRIFPPQKTLNLITAGYFITSVLTGNTMYAQISKIVVLLAAAILLALTGQAEAKQITLRWTKRSMKATGMDGRRRLDARRKIMRVCSLILCMCR